MTPFTQSRLVTVTVATTLLLTLGISAQDQTNRAEPQAKADAEQKLQDMIKDRGNIPPIQPTTTNQALLEAGPGGVPLYSGQPTVDPRVVGTAPNLPQPKLRREGEFIPLRRGRIARSPDASQVMFVFDADSTEGSDAPMFIMPCKTLESMEDIVAEQGDKVVFRLAGQVFTYRGANYLLPTVMKQASNRGNLKN